MRIGVGLPTAMSGVDGRVVVDWARRAEDAGFDSVAVIDRLVAPTWDPLTALAAAAAVTSRVALWTSVLLSPLRPAAVLAAQASTVDRLSGGRLRLGLAVGSRPADYAAARVPFHRRGALLDEQVSQLREIWASPEGFTVPGPAPTAPGGPPLYFGGRSPASVRRTVEHGAGWICGVGGAPALAATAPHLLRAWADANRDGAPELLSVVSFGTDPATVETFLRGYYGEAPFLEAMIRDTPASPAALADLLAAHRNAGCTEVLLFPCAADPRELAAVPL